MVLLAFNSAGDPVQSLYGPCGLTGTHQFQILGEGTQSGYYKFVFRIDGAQIASTLSAASWAYTNRLPAVSEIFSFGTYTIPPFLPSVTFAPALQFYNCAGGCGWGVVSGAKVYRGYVAPCPTLYVAKSSPPSSVRTYSASSGTCLANGAPLW